MNKDATARTIIGSWHSGGEVESCSMTHLGNGDK